MPISIKGASGSKLTLGNNPVCVALTERSTKSTSYIKMKEFKINTHGYYRVKFWLGSGFDKVYAIIYKNGAAISQPVSATGTQTADFVFNKNDSCEIWAKTTGVGSVFIRDATLNCLEAPTVILN